MRVITSLGAVHPDRAPFDVAERKGIGHPDSLADLVADSFSRRYSTTCREQFGAVPNHWVDKVNLVGAAADVRFGGYDIRKPVDCYLFGKLTERIDGTEVPVLELFDDVVRAVLTDVLEDRAVLGHLRMYANNTAGTAVDHDAQFYQPRTAAAISHVLESELVANDTVMCAGAGLRGVAARTAVWLETVLTGTAFRQRYKTGTDVKVMVVRDGSDLEVTAAVPFRPECTESWSAYRTALDAIRDEIWRELKRFLDETPIPLTMGRLYLNTKDVPGRGYLAPFGTSLGKGDCGAVGRGNRYNGAIEPLRPASGEAPAGKNPLHHVGKIYTAVADDLARRILAELGVYAEVVIAARNGDRLDEPAYVLIRSEAPVGNLGEALALEAVGTAPSYCERFLTTDPVSRFREPGHS
ncbi:methionine adenosyltransferase [Micromonospora halophytica]|uniref:Methionine adenosyltransferase n=1 Tax=Micromonospora halophytica TaxID=47864 RepID=A0A1C5IML5_9ACTN|nr:methionine adenosyltransferase [Micromonospora halophytica]SCG59554.1 methionine adenosyltransferase [Micromonospora halophytica]